MATDQPTRKRFLRFWKAMLLILGTGVAVALYLVSVAIRSRPIFQHIQTHRHSIGSIFAADELRGHRSAENGHGWQQVGSRDIEFLHDADGCRIPPGYAPEPGRDAILFLGCSWTHGWSCVAEEAYPFLVAEQLNMNCKNAATSGTGLAHMLPTAREMIPKHKPSHVVVQYSPWLVDRAQQYYRVSFHGRIGIASPYFHETNGQLQIAEAAFPAKALEMNLFTYRGKTESEFFWNAGIPFFLHNDWHRLALGVKTLCGRTPIPTSDRQRIVKHAYGELAALAENHDARMWIVIIDAPFSNIPADDLSSLDNVVDAYSDMLAALPEPTNEKWYGHYCHWNDARTRVLDFHPNADGHQMIADSLVRAITASTPTQQANEAKIDAE